MSAMAVFGVKVPPKKTMVPAAINYPATIRITMAALDPTQLPEADASGNIPTIPRSTLKMTRFRIEGDDDSEEDDDYLESIVNGHGEDSDEDDEANGGPSDPSKSKKALQEAAIQKLMEATKNEGSDDEMQGADMKRNRKSKKGKEKASDEESGEDSDGESDDEDEMLAETYVVCTLDSERTYQQPLDISISPGERVYFSVDGNHTVYLTGNYLELEDDEEDEEDEYDLPLGIDGMAEDDDDSELSDELDAIDGVDRIQEIGTDEEEAPKLVATKKEKKSKKRPAEEENLDDLISKEEPKLSKKQLKRLKNNKGEAVAAVTKDSPAGKSDKKVQFAKNLEQGPTGPAKDKQEQGAEKQAATPGIKQVQGVTLDDRKIGKGRTVKNGDRVSLRYIGKLQNGKVFDANKKGTPFSFKVGKGEVIRGWDIGIVGMQVGGERRLTIPSNLAYGTQAKPQIPANSTLVFDVKLLEIK